MKIYLKNENYEWQLFEGTAEELKPEFKKRNISIGYGALIGNGASIGYGASIGNRASIGDEASIGYGASIGDMASIGYRASIGDMASIGYRASIGDMASIGDRASIGDEASIGYGASIGYRASIGKFDIFSPLSILVHIGVTIDADGNGLFFKCVNPDLTDFYSGKYQYVVGKGGSITGLKRDQDVECGRGFHFTDYWKAVEFANGRDHKIISAKINIKDILSVHTKVRVRKYSDVQLVELSGEEI